MGEFDAGFRFLFRFYATLSLLAALALFAIGYWLGAR